MATRAGSDLGLASFATPAARTMIHNSRGHRPEEASLRRCQRRVEVASVVSSISRLRARGVSHRVATPAGTRVHTSGRLEGMNVPVTAQNKTGASLSLSE